MYIFNKIFNNDYMIYTCKYNYLKVCSGTQVHNVTACTFDCQMESNPRIAMCSETECQGNTYMPLLFPYAIYIGVLGSEFCVNL